jgi:hypothetical protein
MSQWMIFDQSSIKHLVENEHEMNLEQIWTRLYVLFLKGVFE